MPRELSTASDNPLERELALDREIVVSQLEHGPLTLAEIAELIDNNEAYTSASVLRPLKQMAKTHPHRIRFVSGKWHLARLSEGLVDVRSPELEARLAILRQIRDHGSVTPDTACAATGCSMEVSMEHVYRANRSGWIARIQPNRTSKVYGFGPIARKHITACKTPTMLDYRILQVLGRGPMDAEQIRLAIGSVPGVSTSGLEHSLETIEACTGLVREVDGRWQSKPAMVAGA